MGMWVGRGRKARVAYGFDDISLVPGMVTVNPNEVDISWEIGGRRFEIPIIAAAMDGVVDPKFAIEMGRLGGFAVLNLEGVQSRYGNPDEVLDRRDLLEEFFGHRFAVGLIILEPLVPKGGLLPVKTDGEVIRLFLVDELPEHRHEAVDRIRGLAPGGGKRANRVKRPVTERMPVNQKEPLGHRFAS